MDTRIILSVDIVSKVQQDVGEFELIRCTMCNTPAGFQQVQTGTSSCICSDCYLAACDCGHYLFMHPLPGKGCIHYDALKAEYCGCKHFSPQKKPARTIIRH